MTDTITFPGSLKQALIAIRDIRPGDRLLLRAGTYTGDFTATIKGNSDNYITIMPYPGERVIIDGSLIINTDYVIWRDLEIIYSEWTTRTSEFSGGTPADIPYAKTFSVNGVGNILHGLIVHDTAGNSSLSSGSLTKITGCLFYNCGWKGADRGHGHSMYLQNITGRKTVKRSISVNSFGWPWHAYTESEHINYIDYIETTCISPGAPVAAQYYILTGGYVSAIDPHWYRNMGYNCGANIGYTAEGGATDVIRVDNYLPDGCSEVGTVTYTTDSGNTLSTPASGSAQFCYVDEYKTTKGFLTVYNWDLAATFEADVTNITGLAVGDTVRLRCAENYFSCYQDLELDADKHVVIDMRAVSHTVATATAHDFTPTTTCPEFGCFVVEKV
jgi:hypothetical protein